MATHASGWRLLRLSAERRANSRRDLVYLARLASGRDRPSDWTISEAGRSIADLSLDEKFWIVAGGHFPISAQLAMLQAQPSDRDLLIVAAGQEKASSPAELRHQLRTRLQYAAAKKAAADLNASNTGTTTVSDRGPLYLWSLLTTLQKSAGTFSLLIDVAGEGRMSYTRPFAGFSNRVFAMGAPLIARLAQCQVVPYVATFGKKPRSVVIEWGPHSVLDSDSVHTDSLDRLLDWLEKGVARYPTQYLFPIGIERSWDPMRSLWTANEPSPDVPVVTSTLQS